MRKLTVLILVLIVASLAMFSCDGTGRPAGGGSGGVFSEGTTPVLIFADDVTGDAQTDVYQAVKTATGIIPEYGGDSLEETEREIVVGNTSRAISRKAYRKLRTVQKTNDYEVAYVIYASGNSVAIAYDEDIDDLGEKFAVEHFVNNYVNGKTELKLTPGVVYSGTRSVLDYYAAIDAEKNEIRWQKLIDEVNEDAGGDANGLGEELVKAFKSLYSIYDTDVVLWFANLYEPFNCVCGECVNDGKTVACYGGGYYYSNSGRDNEGYGPDTESTSQALNFITSSGIAQGQNYSKVIPDFMREQVIKFIRSCQDPRTGFFYNPQWSIADTNAHVSRRARDLNWCTGILSNLKSIPIYDAPNGVKGEQRIQSASITQPLGQSAASMASKVVYSAAYDPNFESLDTLKAYLKKLEDAEAAGKRSFYAIGNEITAQMPQIIARDKELETWGTKDSMAICVTDWFSKHQSPVTGTWEETHCYLGVNSLLKISGIYTEAKVAMPYAAEAANSAILAITSDEEMGAVVDLYNTWFSVSNVLKNLRQFGGAEGIAKADQIVNDLRLAAPAAIRKSAEKISDFAKPDGSYSYTKLYSSSTSQGMPVAVPNSVEGDVNATVISITGIFGNIYSALELDARGHLFGSRESRIYFDTIRSLGPVQKITASDVTATAIDFEDDTAGELSAYATTKLTSTGAKAVVENVGGTHGNAINFVSVKGGGDNLFFANDTAKTGKSLVFESDYLVKSAGTDIGYFMQISMGSSYMYSFDRTATGIKVFESTTASSQSAYYNDVATLPLDEWFNVRVEYYGGDSGTVRVKLYINGELIVVSDNFKGKDVGNPDVKPANGNYTQVSLYAMSSLNVSLLMDNVLIYADSTPYTAATEADTEVIYDVERGGKVTPGTGGGDTPVTPPAPPKTSFDFEDDTVGAAPAGIETRFDGEGTVLVAGDDTNKYVTFTSNMKAGNYVYIPNNGDKSGACYVFESKMRVNSAGTTTDYVSQINLGGAYMFCLGIKDGKLRIFEATTANWQTCIEQTVTSVALDEWFDIRVEYYKGDASTVRIKFYVNGDLYVVSDNYYTKTSDGSGGSVFNGGYVRTQIYAMGSAKLSIDIDNACSKVTSDAYTPATAEDTKVVYNVDAAK